MKVFVDTSAWAAYYDPSDRWHAAARDAIRRSVHARVTFVTTDYVLDETLTLLLMHAGRPAAIQFGESVQQSRNVERVHVDPGTWDAFKVRLSSSSVGADYLFVSIGKRTWENEHFQAVYGRLKAAGHDAWVLDKIPTDVTAKRAAAFLRYLAGASEEE